MPWPMLDEFLKHTGERKLLAPKAKVLVAVSGGLDSVALCSLLHEAGIPFVMAHCNFGLRGKESDGDEQFVKRLAGQYKVPCHTVHLDAAGHAGQAGLSVQEAARNLRYAWFEKVRKSARCRHIVTAHHLDDSMET